MHRDCRPLKSRQQLQTLFHAWMCTCKTYAETCAVCSSAPPPAVEPVSCCQVLRFSAMEGCKRVGNPLWLCMIILLLAVFSSLFVKTSEWQVFSETHDFSPPSSAPTFPRLSILASCWAWKSPISLSTPLPFWPPFSPCQAVRYKFSLKAVTHGRVAAFPTTLESK